MIYIQAQSTAKKNNDAMIANITTKTVAAITSCFLGQITLPTSVLTVFKKLNRLLIFIPLPQT